MRRTCGSADTNMLLSTAPRTLATSHTTQDTQLDLLPGGNWEASFTGDERERHFLTHLLPSAGCEQCVAARGVTVSKMHCFSRHLHERPRRGRMHW